MEAEVERERQRARRVATAAERVDEAESRIPRLGESAFAAEVLAHPETSLVVFYLATCAACHALFVRLHRLTATDDRARIFRVDCDLSRELAVRQRITNVPALLVYANGQERARREGLIPESALKEILDSLQ